MGSGILTRYNASAGSGKTYKLTGVFLTKLFTSKVSFKKILAVTFTNKAASEMKRKILSQLYSIASGEKSEMLHTIISSTHKTEDEIRKQSKIILHSILHDYSSFNVGTIDSFFQRILKSFTREIGLNHGYIIELDHSLILKQAVDLMFSSASEDLSLLEWITEYSYQRAESGKSWNLREDIYKLAGEIFREKFRLMAPDERNRLRDRTFLNDYLTDMKKIRNEFRLELREKGLRCRELLEKHRVTDEMFLRGDRGGIPSFLKIIAGNQRGIWRPATATVNRVLESPPVWSPKNGPPEQLSIAINEGFGDLFIELLNYYNSNLIRINTGILVSENIYILGILANILDQVHKITSSENRFLLSDAGELLWLIVRDDQTPFIYEKAGNTFENFMIDEFQDTSHIQWNNFRPLIENSMSEGNDNLIVGDVKQSIYRWRNSDWMILSSVVSEQVRGSGLHDRYLDTNWRSRKNIVEFNNSLFTILPGLIDKSGKNPTGKNALRDIYSGAKQKYPGNKDGGIVNIEFLDEENKNFRDAALSRLPALIEDLQDQGYSGSDIGILVRTNREGALVLNKILDYRESVDRGKSGKYNYNIISSESLLLSASPVINFIVALLNSLYESGSKLNLCLMIRNWTLITGSASADVDLTSPVEEASRLFPVGYKEFLERIRETTLFESVEKIIQFFKLGEKPGYSAYLSSFQDCVLEYASDYSSDIPSFLEWWESTGLNRSVVVSDQPDSMRVLTIHKSKGLEFNIVIIPFISWNMGHGSTGPVIWVRPITEPFNKLGTVPVKYKSDLQHSEFAGDYFNETYNVMVDNINLLYVAFTRAVDGLYGFCPCKARSGSVATTLLEALEVEDPEVTSECELNLSSIFDKEKRIFHWGDTSVKKNKTGITGTYRITTGGYYVNHGINRLRLKFHGENWLLPGMEERKKRINHGLLMHEILESVKTADDIPGAVQSLLLRGRITGEDRKEIESGISKAFANPRVKEWFTHGPRVMNESVILCEDGSTRRPDRVLITDEKAIVIDFKFGKENKEYLKQVSEYMRLIAMIETKPVEGYVWYVDSDIILRV